MRVLVTGANGFVGKALIARLVHDQRLEVRGTVRRESGELLQGVDRVVVSEVTSDSNWQLALSGVDLVVHLAARVHVIYDQRPNPLAEFRRVNVEGTLNLGRQAAAAGVKRFVFLSSIKVNGESGTYAESDPPAPRDAYGISKYEAELGLQQIGGETGIGLVIIRPPLVYGPGVKGNFLALMRAVARGLPLPLGAIDNRRSMVGLDNLVDFVVACIEHPAAANEKFFVSDGEDLSTTNLIRRLARAMGRQARLFPVPAAILMAAATVLNKRDAAERLIRSLQVDISKARQILGWTPPYSVDEGLQRAAAAL